jgi:hypothetical protein
MQRLPVAASKTNPAGRWRIDCAPSAPDEGEVFSVGRTRGARPGWNASRSSRGRRSSYGIATVAGEHGGATLAEVVAPGDPRGRRVARRAYAHQRFELSKT